MGKFVISKTKNGEFHFNLKAGNGEIILTSETYTQKINCEHGIESVRTNAPNDAHYDRKVATNGKHYFNLKATNGQVIGSSEMYESKQGMETGITAVKNNAPTAPVEEKL
ncbi:YegP family protein [Chitinophaga sancti]|uniref:YegP family protein n=1 Tax=Chitinophaga sancti TaxID=1004 RepID=UPI003F7A8DB2